LASFVRVISFGEQDVAVHGCNTSDIQAGFFSWLDRSLKYGAGTHPV